MTDSRKDLPRGYNLRRVQRVETILDRLRAENAKRVKCPHCPLMIAPETMARHIARCHED